MQSRLASACVAVTVALSSHGRALAQTPVESPTLSSYTFFWTLASDPTNTPITSASVASGSNIALRFWLREAAGGNALSASDALGNGLGGYDMRVTWTNTAALQIPLGTGVATAVNTNVSPNPYAGTTSTPGFGTGGFRNSQTAAANTAADATWGRSSSPGDSTNWADAGSLFNSAVVGTTGGNFVGAGGTHNVLLTQINFAASGPDATVDVTGAQSTGLNTFLYSIRDIGGTLTNFTLDTLIGNTSATVQIQVAPVPEPGSVLLIGTAGLAVAGWVRRRTRLGNDQRVE